MPSTYESIKSGSLSSAAFSLTLTDIPQNYTDLIIICGGSRTSSVYAGLAFNGAASGYSGTRLWGTGSGTGADRGTTAGWSFIAGSTPMTSGRPTYYIVDVMDYASTDKFKPVLMRDFWGGVSGGSGGIAAVTGTFHSTAAITSVTFTSYEGNFEAGTFMDIFGIKRA